MTTSCTSRQRATAVLTALVIGASSMAMPLAHAQNDGNSTASPVDYEPPLLEHEVVGRGVAGESQVFLATVSDDQSLDQVTLFYRFRGDEQYASLPMTPLDQSENFTVSINTSARDTRNIEYYIEASDASGNRVVQGFVFEPLVRVMEPAPLAIGETDEAVDEAAPGKMSLTRKIVYVALGVLVVGGIAAAIDSSSDSDSGSGSGGSGDGGSGDGGSGDDGGGTDTGGDTGGVDDSAGAGDAAAGTDDSSAGDDAAGGGDTVTEVPVVDAPTDTGGEVAAETGGEPAGVQLGGSGLGFGVSF